VTARPTRSFPPLPSRSAERGLSNYLLFERARADPKIAKHMAKTDKFTYDGEGDGGNLVRLEDAQRAGSPTSGVVIGSGKLPGIDGKAAPLVGKRAGGAKKQAEGEQAAPAR
jgi:hypothetical protein